MVKLIVFDFDGVIITGSNSGYFLCYHKALEHVGITLEPDEEYRRIMAYWGKGYKIQLAVLVNEHPEKLEKAIASYEHYYHDTDLFTQNIHLIPGARETLLVLAKTYTLTIASGMIRKTMDELLHRFALSMFQDVITIDELKREADKKPSSFMVDTLREKFQAAQEETVVIGDAASDIEMARNAGVEPIAVLTGHLTQEEAQKLAIQKIIPDITHLPEVLT